MPPPARALSLPAFIGPGAFAMGDCVCNSSTKWKCDCACKMRAFRRHYEQFALLGAGSFGQVSACRAAADRSCSAIKIFRLNQENLFVLPPPSPLSSCRLNSYMHLHINSPHTQLSKYTSSENLLFMLNALLTDLHLIVAYLTFRVFFGKYPLISHKNSYFYLA